MKRLVVNEEMKSMGGGNWLLERKVVIDSRQVVYCRLCTHYFTVSLVSADDLEFVTNPDDLLMVEIGSLLTIDDDMTCDEKDAVNELVNNEWFGMYTEMVRSWHQHKLNDKKPVSKPKVTIGDVETSLVIALEQHIKGLDNMLGHTDSWFDLKWTIGFGGMSIDIVNCPAIYNAINDFIKNFDD